MKTFDRIKEKVNDGTNNPRHWEEIPWEIRMWLRNICGVMDKNMHLVDQAVTTSHRERSLLNSLLAIIHGDGGHYTAEHGVEKSYDDAVTKFYKILQFKRNIEEVAKGE